MKRIAGVFLLAVALCAPTAIATAQQNKAEQMYQQALYEMEGKGNYEKSLGIFRQIMKDFSGNRRVSAKAQFQIGVCYEKLGKSEAQNAYERIIKQYPDQADLVAQARTRLIALRPATGTGSGPVTHRILSKADIGLENLIMMKPSPEGKRVAYMDPNDGSVNLKDLTTGITEKLAEGLPTAFNTFPLFSPDGDRIAYLSATDKLSKISIKMIDLATRKVLTVPGTEMPIKMGSSHALLPVDWSRDGRTLLLGPATLGGDTRGPLGIMPASGGDIAILADTAAGSASFSPDGRYVTYASGDKGREQVFVQLVAGGARTRISDAEGGNTSPFWSPDGRAIAYQRPDGIWFVPVADGKASGAPRLVHTTTVTLNLQAWTEAGGLYFTLYNDAKIPYQLKVDPNTGAPKGSAEQLPHHPTADVDFKWSRSRFAWSPNKQRIAFAGWNKHIAIYAADGSNVASQVLQPGEIALSLWWSSDGREVLYLSSLSKSAQEDLGVATMGIDATTGKIREKQPRSLSPAMISQTDDGRRSLYLHTGKDQDPVLGLVVLEKGQTKGTLVASLTDSTAGALSILGDAQLSPRGDKILFGRQIKKPTEGAGSLWVVAVDGTGLRKLGSVNFLSSAVWDPTGRFVAYTGSMGKKPDVFRVVEVSSGAERDLPLPDGIRLARVTDWSRDGTLIGIIANQSRWEYWSLQGLQDGVR